MVPGLIPDYEPPDRERIMLSCQISVAKIKNKRSRGEWYYSGTQSIANGWIAVVEKGLLAIDAGCNGRAYPTGVTGALGLHLKSGYKALQAAVGGVGEKNRSCF